MSSRTLLRATLWTVVVLDIALGCWWMLKSDAPDAGRPGSRTWQQTEFERSAMPALPPRHAPPRAAPAAEPGAEVTLHANSARGTPSGPSQVVLEVGDTSKAPLSGVTVVATESNGAVRSTVTAADGMARFESVTPDAVELVLSRSDLATQRIRPIAIEPGVRTIQVTMSPGRAIEGVVLETDGTPVGGAVVTVGDASAWPATATTSYDGRFHVSGVPVSAMKLYVSAPLHASGTADVAGKRDTVEVRLAPACRLYGTVCDSSGAPIADALVTAIPEGDANRSRAERGWTDADGRYAIDGMPLGLSWGVEATKPGFAPGASSSPVKLDADCRSAWCNLALLPAAHVTVRVVDDGGKALSGVVVEARLSENRWLTRRPTDADGAVVFDVPGSGACRFSVFVDSWAEWSADVDVATGDNRTVELRRPSLAEVDGNVEDDLGHPVEGAQIRVDARSARSGPDGRFRLERVPSGPCRFDASAVGYTDGTSGDITIPCAGVRIALVRQGSVSFRLRAATGTPFFSAFATGRLRSGPTLRVWNGSEIRVPADAGEGRFALFAEGFLPVERAVTVRPGEDTPVGEIVLDAGVTVEVRITDDAGIPISGARVTSSHAPLELQPTTDAAGISRIEHVDPAMKDLKITVGGMTLESVTVACEKVESPVFVTLRRTGHVWVSVKSADGSAASGVETHFEGLDPVVSTRRTETTTDTTSNGEGRTQAWLPAGRWRVRVVRGSETLAERDVDVRPGDDCPLVITLEK